MANPLTVAEYTARMKHAIGNADPSTGFTLLEVLNESLRDVFQYHDWSWRKRPPALVSLVANQSYVDLPADFGEGELLSVHSTFYPTHRIVKVGLGDIADLRGMFSQGTLTTFVAVATPTQASSTVRPGTARLEIYPTPTVDSSNAFRVIYKSGPVDLAGSTDVPNVPRSFESALSKIARGKIMKYEFGAADVNATTELNDGFLALEKLKEYDGQQEEDAGPITGGAVKVMSTLPRNDLRPFSTFPDH